MAESNKPNYESNQNFKLDMNKVYNSYIKVIDEFRSKTNIINKENKEVISKYGLDSSSLKAESEYQESRCHAFFRVIGFPVVKDGDFSFYNPGWYIWGPDPKYEDKNITPNPKISPEVRTNIASTPISGFNTLSNVRELAPLNYLKVFSKIGSFDASLLSLTSITALRNFRIGETFINSMQFDSQSYEANLKAKSGDQNTNLDSFIGPPGDEIPNKKNLFTGREHIISPFIVDARYDWSVDTKKIIAAPFLYGEEQLHPAENVTVKRPWIEKIIKDRLATAQDDAGKLQELKKYVKEAKDISSNTLVSSVISNNNKYSEQVQFLNFINLIRTMLQNLLQAQKDIFDAQQQYYYLPIPSKIGPEGGSAVRQIFLSGNSLLWTALFTEKDQDIVINQIKTFLNDSAPIKQFNAQATSATYVSSGTEYVTSAFDPQTTDANGNKVLEGLEKLNKTRSDVLGKANDALKNIEIIMGEFSGLGLCDIIAVMGALYIIPLDNLIGFLDDDAFERMQIILEKQYSSREKNLVKSLEILTNTVKDFYNLMDTMYMYLRDDNQNIFNS